MEIELASVYAIALVVVSAIGRYHLNRIVTWTGIWLEVWEYVWIIARYLRYRIILQLFLTE